MRPIQQLATIGTEVQLQNPLAIVSSKRTFNIHHRAVDITKARSWRRGSEIRSELKARTLAGELKGT